MAGRVNQETVTEEGAHREQVEKRITQRREGRRTPCCGIGSGKRLEVARRGRCANNSVGSSAAVTPPSTSTAFSHRGRDPYPPSHPIITPLCSCPWCVQVCRHGPRISISTLDVAEGAAGNAALFARWRQSLVYGVFTISATLIVACTLVL